MTQDELVNLLAGMKKRVSSSVEKTIRRILVLAREYSYLGKQFAFDVDADLDDEVNRILVELSDAVLDDADTAIYRSLEDDEDSEGVFAYVYRDDPVARMDSHSSNLKYLIEGYLAICFAKSLTNADILGGVSQFLSAPNAYGQMKAAFGDTAYRSTFVRDGGFHFGKGVATNPVEGMTLLAQTMINEGYHNGVLSQFRRNPRVIGYRVVRGSNFPCAICEEATMHVYPLTEQVLPEHNRCMCYEVPVFEGE